MIRAVIFDMGGVLVRTDNRVPRTELARRFGMTYEELDDLVFDTLTADQAAIGDLDVEQHWDFVCRSLGVSLSEKPAIRKAFWGGDQVDKQLADYIRSLHPRYKTALLSNAWNDSRRTAEERWKVLDAFDVIIFSSEVHLMKPDARIYQLAVERLGVEPQEAVFVDDFPENVEAARAAGLQAVRFRSTEQVVKELDGLLDGKGEA